MSVDLHWEYYPKEFDKQVEAAGWQDWVAGYGYLP